MTCVRSVEAWTVTVPLDAPVRNGTATITEREYVVVRVTADDGTAGTAHALTRGLALGRAVRSTVGPTLVGRDPVGSALWWDAAWHSLSVHGGRSGLLVRALSAVDIALWDLKGRLLGAPVCALLGAAPGPVPALAAAGYYRDGDLRAEYARLRDEGWPAAKAMVGALPPVEDAARVDAATAGFGADVAVDANGAWRSADAALRFLKAVEGRVTFVEEPFRPDDLGALRRLRAATDVDLAVGEFASGRQEFTELVRGELVDVVRVDATVVGGVTEWLVVAGLAAAHRLRVVPHYYPEVHAHLVAATPDADLVEVVPHSSGAENLHRLLRAGPVVRDGAVVVGDAPGFGLEWDWDVVERLTRPLVDG